MLKRCTRCGQLKPLDEFYHRPTSPDGHKTDCIICCNSGAELERVRLVRDSLKRCTRCDIVKPLSGFHKNSANTDGYTSHCRKCRQETRYPGAEKNRQEKQRLRNARIKRCWRCGKTMPYSSFFNSRTEPDGKTSLCKHCHTAYQRERRHKYEKSREACNRQSRKWCRENPDKRRATIERRRARMKGANGSFTSRDIKHLRRSQKNTCVYCGLNPNCHGLLFSYHLDHIVPLSRGGSNNPENLQLLCSHCNQSKLDKTHEEYLEWLQAHYDQ